MVTVAPWRQNLRLLEARPDARTRIICLPPAGAGASTFRSWTADAPAGIEIWAVQLPGREDRLAETPVTDLASAAHQVATALQWLVDRPCVLFGHSMGALVGYEAARILAAQRIRGVSHLVVSGCLPPDSHRPEERALDRDQDVLGELAGLGLSSPAFDDPETRSVVLPAMRGDLRMFYSYGHRVGPPLTCPITALAGDEDPHVGAEDLLGWQRHTSATTTTALLPGGHHYLPEAGPKIMELIAGAISEQSP